MILPEQLDPATSTPDTFSIADMHWWKCTAIRYCKILSAKRSNTTKNMLAASARIKELAALRRVDFSKIFPKSMVVSMPIKMQPTTEETIIAMIPNIPSNCFCLGKSTCGEIFVGEQRKEKRNYSKRSKTNAPCK